MFVLVNVHNYVQSGTSQEKYGANFTDVLGTPKVWVCCAQREKALSSMGYLEYCSFNPYSRAK
jgi:hypothetical protein